MEKDNITVSGVMLCRIGDHAIVKVEQNGQWVEVIREFLDSNFSHIVEPSGMRDRIARAAHAIDE